MNRRNFIGKTSLLASVPLVGLPLSKASALEPGESTNSEIIYRTLGRTGIKVPIVSMGVMNATIPGLVVKSYEKGVRLFDTAWFYQNGMNEKMLGETFERMGVRKDVTIMSKIYLREAERDLYQPGIKDLFLQRFEESLSRLRTDYIDILFYHAAKDVKEQNNPYIMEAFEELKKAGKIKHTAVSLHGDDPVQLDDIREKGFYDVVMVKYNIAYAEDERQKNALKKTAEAGIGIVGMKTQCGGGGRMWWKEHEDSRETLGDLNHSALLKWVLQHDYIATTIPGYTTYDQLDENFAVAHDLAFSAEESDFLEKAQVKLAQAFCTGCEKCLASCPARADIPKLMRTYMYAYQYRNMEHALAVHNTMSAGKGITECNKCGKCNAQCARSLNLSNRIEALKELNFC